MQGGVLGGLDQQPAGVAGALFGDGSVIAALAGLAGGRNQSQIRGGFVGSWETRRIAEGGEDSFGDGEIDAGQGHQKLHGGSLVGVHGDLRGESGEFLFDALELAQVAVERIAAEGIEGESFQPGEVLRENRSPAGASMRRW